MTTMRYRLAPVVNAMSFIWVKDLIVLSGICCPLLMIHSLHSSARRLTLWREIDGPIKALYPTLPEGPWMERTDVLGVCHVSQEAWPEDVRVDVSWCALTANSLSRVRILIYGWGLTDWALHLAGQHKLTAYATTWLISLVPLFCFCFYFVGELRNQTGRARKISSPMSWVFLDHVFLSRTLRLENRVLSYRD